MILLLLFQGFCGVESECLQKIRRWGDPWTALRCGLVGGCKRILQTVTQCYCCSLILPFVTSAFYIFQNVQAPLRETLRPSSHLAGVQGYRARVLAEILQEQVRRLGMQGAGKAARYRGRQARSLDWQVATLLDNVLPIEASKRCLFGTLLTSREQVLLELGLKQWTRPPGPAIFREHRKQQADSKEDTEQTGSQR